VNGSSFEWGAELPTLSAPRVTLRSLTREDAADVLAIFGDLEVMRFWSAPPLADLQAAQALVEEINGHFRLRRLFQWGISLNETKEIVGTCTLLGVSTEHQRAEIGFALRRREWGRGLASEAVDRLIAFAFETLGLHRLEADADPENTRSLALLERHGFTKEGHLRERWLHLGERRDTAFMGLLRGEWTGKHSR
jgi:RimJ/RimL family protein N-acetyltransferase